jgi:hypothetical protein
MKATRTSASNLETTAKSLRSSWAAIIVCMLSVACAGEAVRSVPSPERPEPRVEKTAVQLRIAGVPSDAIICFETKLNSIVALGADGKNTTLLSNPITVEMMHWAGDSETVAVTSLERGRYTQIAISATGTRTTYLDVVTGLLATKRLSTSYNATIQFNPALVVGTTPVVLNLQISPANIVNTLGMGNSGTRNRGEMFRVNAARLNTLGLQKPENGRVDRIVGSVTNVSSRSLTVTDGQTGSNLTFRVDFNTRFYNASLSTLQGLIVALRGHSAKDGSLVATDVETLESHTGAVMEGVVSGYIPNSNLMTLASQDASGHAMKSSMMGSGISVDQSNNPNFVVDSNDVDMTGMESLRFNSDSLALGQHVQVQAMSAIQRDSNGNAARVVPETVKLEPQMLIGTIANYQSGSTPGTSTFDLVFATNASMNVLNPFFYTMHVYQQRGTDVHKLSSAISNGATVRVWGLVFYSPLPGGSVVKTSIKADRGRAVQLLGRRAEQSAFLMVAGRISGN